ncbi:hypothetical protein VU04_10700 [Desulfobulbus sp. TB]|nr:hypothetical protein [Desulfobulbus sp. TB]
MKKISIFLTLATIAVMLGGCYIPPAHYQARAIHSGVARAIHPGVAVRAYRHPAAVRRYRHPPAVRRYRHPVMIPAPRIIVPPRRAVFY